MQHEYFIYTYNINVACYIYKHFASFFIKEGKEPGGLRRDTPFIATEGRKLPSFKFPRLCFLLPVKVN